MSNSDWLIRNFPRAIRMEFLDRCDREGLKTADVLEAWVKRAIRQERSVMPEAVKVDDNLLQMRGGR